MARATAPRLVQCYHCRHRFEVSARAESTSCPGCNKPLYVGDIDVPGQRGPIREIRTCGRITVGKKGRLICESIEAHGGIHCLGIIDSRKIIAGDRVVLGPKAQLKGVLQSPILVGEAGARILSGRMAIPEDPLEIIDLPHGSPTPRR